MKDKKWCAPQTSRRSERKICKHQSICHQANICRIYRFIFFLVCHISLKMSKFQ